MTTANVSLLIAVRRYMDRTGMTATMFGRRAVGDPCFVSDLRNGRIPRDKTEARVRAFVGEPWTPPVKLVPVATPTSRNRAGKPATAKADKAAASRGNLEKARVVRSARAAEGKAYALAWRARMKPYFDALYGPDEWAEDRRLGPTRKQIAALKAAA